MFSLQIHTKTVNLNIDRSTAQSFCQNVLNILSNEPGAKQMSFLGACWLYNKLRVKTNKNIRMKMPLEYGIMVRDHCKDAFVYHHLEKVALYTIHETLDKQLNNSIVCPKRTLKN